MAPDDQLAVLTLVTAIGGGQDVSSAITPDASVDAGCSGWFPGTFEAISPRAEGAVKRETTGLRLLPPRTAPAVAQGGASAVAPDDGFPAGCSGTYGSPFEITVAKVEGEGGEGERVRVEQSAFAAQRGMIVVSRGVASSAVAPDDGCAGGCSGSYGGPFEITVAKIGGVTKRDVDTIAAVSILPRDDIQSLMGDDYLSLASIKALRTIDEGVADKDGQQDEAVAPGEVECLLEPEVEYQRKFNDLDRLKIPYLK
ncbi:hypothetical protein Daus18300_005733 [Diaporthe australafricana]|uniref:Uncharacterized protein n=1 Tax=Diaporthe australafricana TaxID=127596 RepID=A0ABR3WZJ1_9PEZI